MSARAIATADRRLTLRRLLLADATLVGVSGVLLAGLAGPLAGPLGLSDLFLRTVGLGLLPVAVAVVAVATRRPVPRAGALAVAGLNGAWVVASLLLLVSGWIDPTTAGVAFILAQALLVAAFAEAEVVALRRRA